MNTKKLLFVFGTRPEAIKLAPIIILARQYKDFEVKVCVTGQHHQMLKQVMAFFDIQSDYDLKLMKPNQSLNDILKSVLSGLDQILDDEKFDCVVVHGDTSTTMAASMVAFHKRIPVVHIEAGLRTFNLNSPWPEEMNRKVVAILSTWHFAPTQKNKANLLAEGILEEKIFVTGNTVIDALALVVNKIKTDRSLFEQLGAQFSFLDPQRKLVLVTGHRRENFGGNFLDICHGLKRLAASENIQLIYPVHLNPNVQGPVKTVLGGLDNIFLLEPLDYVSFTYLMMEAHIIITDSGGVQEEAPFLGKPVLVMRDSTERAEALEAGTVRLVGASGDNIFNQAKLLIESSTEYNQMVSASNPYGNGDASKSILDTLKIELLRLSN